MSDPEPADDRSVASDAESVSFDLLAERLRLERETFPRERVRLQKFVMSEERTITVTVRREEVRLIREPLDGTQTARRHANARADIVLTLHEERPRVLLDVVPVERVTLSIRNVEEDEQVEGVLRSEHAELVTDEGFSES